MDSKKKMSETVEQNNDVKEDVGLLSSVFNEIIKNPINLALVVVISFLLYKIAKSRTQDTSKSDVKVEAELPKIRRDFTVQELKQYDGTQPDGRVLVAVNGNVYDVTKGKRFYGPGLLHTISCVSKIIIFKKL